MGLVLPRHPHAHIRSIEELGLPLVLKRIADEERGLVLVTGTTGSGKSTTLAGMIDHINRSRCTHDDDGGRSHRIPARDQRSIINQREVAVDTRSFAQALRSALRQDPDVILVGEMRDFETIETGLLAAETGHLVFSTLHTLDATETINRIIAVFPPHQQKQVRLQLASVLKAVISQRLMPRADGDGRAPAVEVMISPPSSAIASSTRDRTHSFPTRSRQARRMRDADLRSVHLWSVPGRSRLLRRSPALGVECGRIQTARAGYFRPSPNAAATDGESRPLGEDAASDHPLRQLDEHAFRCGSARPSAATPPHFPVRLRFSSAQAAYTEAPRNQEQGRAKCRILGSARSRAAMSSPYIDALKMLGRRELSELQIRQRLARKGAR